VLFTIIIVLTWVTALFSVVPAPNDLSIPKPEKLKSFKKIKGSVTLGLILILVYHFTSNGNFEASDDKAFALLGINNISILTPIWFLQLVTNIFVHANWLHLVSNLIVLAILSLYEREVGTRKFLVLFILSGFFASFSVLLNTSPMVSAGASGALFGLGGAYILHPVVSNSSHTTQELITRIILLAVLFIFISLQTTHQEGIGNGTTKIDTWAHLYGLIIGSLLSKYLPYKLYK
jgi:membrane associated rhomboid family serine protease